MTEWVHRCLVVSAANAPLARSMASALSYAGEGMWTTGVSPTGDAPATHYISVGLIDKILADLLVSAEALSAGTGVPIETCRSVLDSSDVSVEEGYVALSRLGLQILKEN